MLNQEEGRAHIDSEQRVEIGDRCLLDVCGFRDAGVGDQDVEAITDDAAHFGCELVRSIGRRKVRADGLGAAAGLADLLDDRISLIGTPAAGLSREALAGAADLRRKDLLVHHALGILNKNRSAQALSSMMVRDVRALFGSQRDLADNAMRYLLGLSDRAKIEELCVSAADARMGAIDEKGRLIVLGSRMADLPGHLRCYIGCAIHLSGEPEGPYLIRLDPLRRRIKFFLIEGKRTSFPSLPSSITVDLKRQDVFVDREHKRLVKKSRLYVGVSKAQVARENKYASDRDYGVDHIIEDRQGLQ